VLVSSLCWSNQVIVFGPVRGMDRSCLRINLFQYRESLPKGGASASCGGGGGFATKFPLLLSGGEGMKSLPLYIRPKIAAAPPSKGLGMAEGRNFEFVSSGPRGPGKVRCGWARFERAPVIPCAFFLGPVRWGDVSWTASMATGIDLSISAGGGGRFVVRNCSQTGALGQGGL